MASTERSLPDRSVNGQKHEYDGDTIPAVRDQEKGKWDWTSALPQTDHVRFLKSVDWASTGLGDIKDWSPTLRQATYQVIADSRPATLYWGNAYVPIYNEAFVPLAGATHPTLMGSTFRQGFPELWAGISPLFEQATRSGIAADVIEAPMTVERNGYPEEAFFTGNFTPIRCSEGKIEGFYNALFEVTEQKVSDRQIAMLNLITTPTDLTTQSVCRHIIGCLETNELDITMAVLYQVDGESGHGGILRLSGHIGVPRGHELLVDSQDWDSSEGLISLCRRARSRGNTPLIVPVDDKFDGITWRGPAGPSKSIAILPLTNGLRLYGILVIGTNPRRLDESNSQFLKDLGRMISGVMASAVSAEESSSRQERLERDLANSDMKIRYLVQHASVGMVHLLLDGTMIWANNEHFAIAGQQRYEAQKEYAFFDVIFEEDLPIAEEAWQKLLQGEEHVSAELRLKRQFIPPVGDPVPATGLLLAFPYTEDGKVLSVMACTTDISKLKWSESWQARSAEDAREARRQQEAFIDVVSHEMRNPLSAIIHCADGIVSTAEECKAECTMPPRCSTALSENATAARIIEKCANHQKYIIDSILTLGRLESEMLSFVPSVVRPGALCESTMAIFEAELRSNDIDASVLAHPSHADHDVREIYADPSRITQIFINLITNAIKFVKAEETRKIQVRYGACISNPRSAFPEGVYWAPKGALAEDVSRNSEWGFGEAIYLTFSIKDSGVGINTQDMLKIFDRFKQASVKTHVKYGGSGLGLFISKQLTEKQGGEIGVLSKLGEGSMFVFYLRVKRVLEQVSPIPPKDLEPRPPITRMMSTPAVSPMGPDPKGSETPVKMHVLLVEDNLINQQVLHKQLTRAGCVVHVADHGIDALEKLKGMNCWEGQADKGNPLDIILMDTQMPVMDGLSCTKEIRKYELEGRVSRHVPIIAVTANVRHEQVNETLAAGSDAIMHKPFKSADLIEMMKDLVKIYTMSASDSTLDFPVVT